MEMSIFSILEFLIHNEYLQQFSVLLLIFGMPITWYIHKIVMNDLLRYKIAWKQTNIYMERSDTIKEWFKSDYISHLEEKIKNNFISWETKITITPSEKASIISRHNDLVDLCFESTHRHIRIKLLSNHIPKPVAVYCDMSDCNNCDRSDCFVFMTYVRGTSDQIMQLIWSQYRIRYGEGFFPIPISERELRFKSGDSISKEKMVEEFKQLCIRWYNVAHPHRKKTSSFLLKYLLRRR